MNIIIKRTKPLDWKSIRVEILALETKIFGKIAFPEEESFDTFKEPEAYNLLVYSDNKIIGYLMSERLLHSGSHNGMKDKEKIFYLESVGLLAVYQGQGIGKKLFNKYLEYGREIGCKSYLLETREKAMIKIAKKSGFKIVRYNKKQFHNGKKWLGAYLMRKDIVEEENE